MDVDITLILHIQDEILAGFPSFPRRWEIVLPQSRRRPDGRLPFAPGKVHASLLNTFKLKYIIPIFIHALNNNSLSKIFRPIDTFLLPPSRFCASLLNTFNSNSAYVGATQFNPCSERVFLLSQLYLMYLCQICLLQNEYFLFYYILI